MKRIFLTGASAGIGLATAKLLTARGDEVWGTSRDPARIPQMPNLHPVRLDLNDSASLGESFHDACCNMAERDPSFAADFDPKAMTLQGFSLIPLDSRIEGRRVQFGQAGVAEGPDQT